MAYRRRGPRSQLWFAKRDAKKRGLAWHISDKRALKLLERPCHWCGAAPNPYSGLDRLNNEPFYHARNVVPCCWPRNRSKGTRTAVEWIRFCANVIAHRFHAVKDGQHLLTMFP